MGEGEEIPSVGEIYELALTAWGVDPDKLKEWSEERIVVLFCARTKRLEREADGMRRARDQQRQPQQGSSTEDGWEIIGG